MKLYDDLKWRGLIKDITNPELEEKLNNGGMTFYWGTDPSADSLHIGHFSSLLMAKRLENYGHKPIILVGGATGLIGDPRPTTERPMITKEAVLHNYECIKAQIKNIFGYEVVNNYDWCKDINFIDFLRDYGKFFNINYMLSKDIIKRRLDEGITYTEFSYMIMQALDFEYLYRTKGCTLQAAGQDQWGNITSGVELIRKKHNEEVYAFTMPLVTDKYGNKIGKTSGNAVWLDKEKFSSYEMYQYLINTDDTCVIDYLKKLTLLSKEEIERIEKIHFENPELRIAQKELAKQIITLLHSADDYENATEISENLFSGNIKNISSKDLMIGLKGVPSFKVELNKTLIDVLTSNNICSSKREAREFLNSSAITINGDIIKDENLIIDSSYLIDNKLLVIRRGKKKYYLGVFGE